MQLARKITLPLALSAFLALGVSAWLSVRAAVSVHHRDVEADQSFAARIFLTALERERARGTFDEGSKALLTTANSDTHRATTRLVRLDELTLTPAQRAALSRGEAVFELDVWKTAETWVPTALADGAPAALWVHEALDAESESVSGIVTSHALNAGTLAFLWAVVAVGLGALIVGRPMRALSEKARRVSTGDYTAPLTIEQNDEIGELAREMNHMCDELTASRGRLERETKERERAQGALRHADRLTTVGLLGAGIAHELGTPLNVVSLRARMIASGELSEHADVRASAESIHEQAGQMTRIIRQLLNFARRSSPSSAPFSLTTMVRESASMLRPLAEKASVRFDLSALDEVEVTGDADQLQQALTNLSVNAVQAMARKGGTVSISLKRDRVTPPPDLGGAAVDCARLEVRDDGPGMDADTAGRIFEPFFTTKPVGEGSGLGLSVTWGIMRDHHGWISVDSQPGSGSTFTLFIPLERPA
jgi:two-component system NtrC family sensor kinase